MVCQITHLAPILVRLGSMLVISWQKMTAPKVASDVRYEPTGLHLLIQVTSYASFEKSSDNIPRRKAKEEID